MALIQKPWYREDCINSLNIPGHTLLYNSEDPPPSKEFEELKRYCENENLYLVMGCD